MPLSNQRVVVLGGSSGIGLAAARAASAAGAEVVVAGRNPARLEAAAATIGGSPESRRVDATDPRQLAAFFAETGPFDHLVLSLSGAKGAGPFRQLDLAALREGFEAKFWAHAAAAQASLATIRPPGSITFVSAVSARTAKPGTAGLAAINAAIEALVPVLAVELAPLRVNAVSPGVVETPWWNWLPEDQLKGAFAQYAGQTPAGRVGQPEDVARAILFLLEDTFVTGTVIECDGGLRLT